LPPEVNRAIYVRNLPFKISTDEMYDIFGKFGALRQIRLGNTAATRGRAYVVYEDIYDAKNAVDHLSGFNVGGRYIIVLYHNDKLKGKVDTGKKQAELEKLKKKYGVGGAGDATPGATPGRPGTDATPLHGSDATPARDVNATPLGSRGRGEDETPAHTPARGGGGETPAHTPRRRGGDDATPARYGMGDETPLRGDMTPSHGDMTPVRRRGGGDSTPLHRGGGGDSTPLHRGGGDSTPLHRGGGGDTTPLRRGGGGDTTPLHRGGGGDATPVRRGRGDVTPVHRSSDSTPVRRGIDATPSRDDDEED
jgi:pre-mRNA branch site protein p14